MISKTGYWSEDISSDGHIHSENIAEFLSKYLDKEKYVIDAGCGLGFYLKYLKDNGFKNLIGIEGKKHNSFMFDGTLLEKDLAEEFNIDYKGNVVCLEVGEHIPEEFEQIFIKNITSICDDILIVSWAVVGQAGIGHVNCKNNDYIIGKIQSQGFQLMLDETIKIREAVGNHCIYFKDTLMMFKRIQA